MKHLVLTVLFLIPVFIFAQETIREKSVPPEVLDDFRFRFHEATDVAWFRQGQDYYGSRFQMREGHGECVYKQNGEWVQSEVEMEYRDLPDSARAYLGEHYGDYTAKRTVRVSTRKFGILFDVHITGNLKAFVVTFDQDGDLVEAKEEVLEAKQEAPAENTEPKKKPGFLDKLKG